MENSEGALPRHRACSRYIAAQLPRRFAPRCRAWVLSDRVESCRADSPRIESSRVDFSRVESRRIASNRVESISVESSRDELRQIACDTIRFEVHCNAYDSIALHCTVLYCTALYSTALRERASTRTINARLLSAETNSLYTVLYKCIVQCTLRLFIARRDNRAEISALRVVYTVLYSVQYTVLSYPSAQ